MNNSSSLALTDQTASTPTSSALPKHYSEWDLKQIDVIYKQLKKELNQKEHVRFQYFLSSHCDTVLREAKKRKRFIHNDSVSKIHPIVRDDTVQGTLPFQSLPDMNLVSDNQGLHSTATLGSQDAIHRGSADKFTVRFHRDRRLHDTTRSQSVSTIQISSLSGEDEELPLPSYAFCLPITEPYKVEDQPELAFVPILEKHDDEQLNRRTILSMHSTSYREDLVRYGAECQQEKTKMVMDMFFQRLFFCEEVGHARIPPLNHCIWEMIAKVTMQPLSRIQHRLKDWVSASVANIDIPQTYDVDLYEHSNSKKRNELDVQYEKATDDFRKLWCRQCYIYDCNLHGLSHKPSVCVQTVLAKEKEKDGSWQDCKLSETTSQPLPDVPIVSNITEVHGLGTLLFKQLYSIFEGNTKDISCILRVPIEAVETYLSLQEKSNLLDVMPPLNVPKGKRGAAHYFSTKNYKHEWYLQYRDSKIFPFFYPCLHDGLCRDALNCTCVDNHFFCTVACSWNKYSPNFFRGCACSGNCSQQCTCFLAKRECDPNLCRCSTCTDPAHQLITKQRCRNDNHIMNRDASVLIGRSKVAGWGLFTRNALKVGDYIGKYIGELMSQDEADRRGLIADARDCTYLFLLSSDLSIDATQKGNKLRYINHSDTPNVEPRSKLTFSTELFI
jgi:SET domain